MREAGLGRMRGHVEILSTCRASKEVGDSRVAMLVSQEGKSYLVVGDRYHLQNGDRSALMYSAIPIEVARTLLRMDGVLSE